MIIHMKIHIEKVYIGDSSVVGFIPNNYNESHDCKYMYKFQENSYPRFNY